MEPRSASEMLALCLASAPPLCPYPALPLTCMLYHQEVDTLGLSFLAQNCEELLHVLVDKCKKRSPLPAHADEHG